MKKYNEMIDFLNTAKTDFEKFYDKGQNAAGTRARKAMGELKKMAQEVRLEIQDLKNKNKEEKANTPQQ